MQNVKGEGRVKVAIHEDVVLKLKAVFLLSVTPVKGLSASKRKHFFSFGFGAKFFYV